MGRRGRPRKQAVTYDSKETKFAIGLVALGLSVIGFLTYLFPAQGTLFSLIKSVLGDATFLGAIFLLNLSLATFGVELAINSKKALVAQAILSLLLAIIFTASVSPLLQNQLSQQGELGGSLGYRLTVLSQDSLFLNLTLPAAIIFAIIVAPIAFGLGVLQFFSSIFEFIKKIFGVGASIQQKLAGQNGEEGEMMQNPTMFGDLRARNMTNNQVATKEPQKKDLDFMGIPVGKGHKALGDGMAGVKVQSAQGSTEHNELKYPDWRLPTGKLLDPLPKIDPPKEDVKNNSTIIEQTLASFGIESKVMDVTIGPSVSQYALDIALGIKVSKIANLKNDLALALATPAHAVRIEVPIPGTSYVGIEIPNIKRRPVFFSEIMGDSEMANPKYQLPVTVGRDIQGKPVIADIQKMPHLLIAGATGSGKSVLTVSFILSMIMRHTPDELRLLLIDPKQVEFSDFNGIAHLLTPVITEMDKVNNSLKCAVAEMEQRYTAFRDAQVKNLEAYNKKMGFAALPYIVIVIDEMADMMLSLGKGDVETSIVRLAQKARATGMHLILATQRPSVNVITGIIKANIPGRIGMSVTTNVDSRVILDSIGAESLLGKGDMLFKEPDKNKPVRVQGVYVSPEEVQRVVQFVRDQSPEVEYFEDIVASKAGENAAGEGNKLKGDTMMADAIRVVIAQQKGSASLLQRKLSIGYNRAAKLLDEMAELGIVGPENGSKPRDVLVGDAEAVIQQLSGGEVE